MMLIIFAGVKALEESRQVALFLICDLISGLVWLVLIW